MSPVSIPAELVRDLLRGRLDAPNRIAAYTYAVANLRDGRPVTAAGLQQAWGLGRNAGYELLALARIEAGARADTTGSADAGRTPGNSKEPGAGPDAGGSGATDGPGAGKTAPPAPLAPGADRERAGIGDDRQTPETARSPGADREPTGNPGPSAGDPPHYSLEISKTQERKEAAEPPAPVVVFPDAPTPASAAFLRTLRRWSTEPDAGDRWKVSPADDLAWFLTEIVTLPEAEQVDLPDVIRKWDLWIEREHRAKRARTKSKFPKVWKTALRNWIGNEVRWSKQRAGTRGGADVRLPNAGRRGGYGADRQRFEITTVAGGAGTGSVDEFEG